MSPSVTLVAISIVKCMYSSYGAQERNRGCESLPNCSQERYERRKVSCSLHICQHPARLSPHQPQFHSQFCLYKGGKINKSLSEILFHPCYIIFSLFDCHFISILANCVILLLTQVQFQSDHKHQDEWKSKVNQITEKMLGNKLMLSLLLVGFIAAASEAKKDYNEECSTLAQLGNLFTSDKDDNPEACDTDKGLVCVASKCVCGNPVTVYEKGILFGLLGGGRCVGMANSPCIGKESSCVANSACGDTAKLCLCNEGYHSKDGRCTNAGIKLGGTTYLYVLGLLLSYVVLGQ